MVRTYWLVPVFYEASGNLDLQPFARIDQIEACRPRAMCLRLYAAVSAKQTSVHICSPAPSAEREIDVAGARNSRAVRTLSHRGHPAPRARARNRVRPASASSDLPRTPWAARGSRRVRRSTGSLSLIHI